MTVTILALLFLAAVLGITFAGYRLIIRQRNSNLSGELNTCSICHRSLPANQLIAREHDGAHPFIVCHECINGMHAQITDPAGHNDPP
jgi:hypothetical protein